MGYFWQYRDSRRNFVAAVINLSVQPQLIDLIEYFWQCRGSHSDFTAAVAGLKFAVILLAVTRESQKLRSGYSLKTYNWWVWTQESTECEISPKPKPNVSKCFGYRNRNRKQNIFLGFDII